MKLVKSLLLGSAAGLAVAAGAQAADLPMKKAAPVEYVKICNTYGAGFFYIPGVAETCLRVSGRVRADYRYNTPGTRAQDAVGFFTRGRIQLDARTSTAYGLLRSVVRFELNRGLGYPGAGSNGTIANVSNLAQAFIQFGGLTAGRVTTMFDNGDLPTGHMGTLRFSDSPDVDLIAYTFTFGNGFSATLSLEDGIERRAGLVRAGFGSDVYGGQRAPDVVGNIKYAGTWGTAQLSAAGHQIRVANPYAINGFSDTVDTEYGYAIQANVGVNLPTLGAGDALWLNAVYANGALGYITGGSGSSLGISNSGLTGALVDGYVNANGNLSTGHGWSVAGGIRHYWTPGIRQNVFGSYARISYSGATPIADFNELRVGSNVFWTPVAGLDIGVEAIYVKLDPRASIGQFGVGNTSEHAWEGRVRVQRDF